MSATNSVSGSAAIPGLRCPVCKEEYVEFQWMPAIRARQQGCLICTECGYESDQVDFDEFDDLKGTPFLKHWKPSRKELGIDKKMDALEKVGKDLQGVCVACADPNRIPIGLQGMLAQVCADFIDAMDAYKETIS